MKTRSKLILLLVSIFFSLLLIFSTFIYVFLSRHAFTDFYKRLETRSYSTARSELGDPSDSHLIRKFKREYLEILPEERHYILQVTTDQSIDYLSEKHHLSLSLLKDILTNNVGTHRNKSVLYCGIKYQTAGKTYIVITSAKNYFLNHYTSYLGNLLIVSTLVSLLLIFLIAYWLSKRLINPIQEITQKVNKIGSENLNIRLEESGEDDEMSELIRTFNNMLDRLETSFETQNNFISNASHELNTPLTAIIGEADVALARIRSSEEYIEALLNILEEAEKLDKKTKALLYLAQTGFNGKALTMSKVRVDQLILDVMETIGRIYPKNKVHIDFSSLPDSPEKLKILGNEQLLHLALSNIILNACKYSNNDEVIISLKYTDTHLLILISDKGIGIPQEELQYVYNPFFRASNSRNFEGYGIGLPLTRNIIKLHRGEIIISSEENKGTSVEVRLNIGNFTL